MTLSRSPLRILGAFVAALAASGCNCSGTAGQGTPVVFELPTDPLDFDDTIAPHPNVTVSVHGTANLQIGQGWPLVISGLVSHPSAHQEQAPAPMVLGGTDVRSALALQLIDEAGTAVALAPTLQGGPVAGPVELDADTWLNVRWTVAGDQTSSLAPGKYQLRALLEASAGSEGWKGRHSSPPAVIEVLAAPLPAELESTRRLLVASYRQATGDAAGAKTELDQLLASDPKNLEAITFRADLIEAAGDTAAALAEYNRALEVFVTSHESGEPPDELLIRRDELIEKLASGSRP